MNILKKNKRHRNNKKATLGMKLSQFLPFDEGKSYKKKRKRHVNSFKNNTKKKLRFITQQKKRYYLIVGISILFIILISIIYSPLLSIKHIDIYKLSPLIHQNKAYDNVAHARGKHILAYDTKNLVESLKKGQNAINGVKISFHFPSKIKIVLSAYDPFFQTESFVVLENGSVISKSPSYSLEVPHIEISEDISSYQIEKKQLPEIELRKISHFLTKMQSDFPSISIKKIRYYQQEKEIHIKDGYENILIFDLFRDVGQSISQAAIFHEEGESLLQKKWVYIDFRIPGKTYSCERNQDNNPCENNMKKFYSEIATP